MLAETSVLLRALTDAGIAVAPRNPRVQSPGRTAGKCLRVRLGEDGDVVGVEVLLDEEWPGLWTVREGNQNSFPVVRPPADAAKAALLWSRLRDEKAPEIEEVTGGDLDAAPVREMARRFRSAAADVPQLAARLAAHRVAAGEAIQLAFDVDGGETIYRDRTRSAVERLLPTVARKGTQARLEGRSALSGRTGPLQRAAFPKVPLPVLNREFPLVSMFSDARCNVRYGLTDSAIVPVLEDEAIALQDALVHVTSKDREGRTWRGVASGRFEGRREKYDLLIAFVEGRPEIPARIADLFGSRPDGDQRQWEVDASAVCVALDGIARQQPLSRLDLFILREVSPGQVQVVLALRPTVEQVLSGARFWQEAARNVPPIAIPVPRKAGQPAALERPPALAPAQVVRVLGRKWVNRGIRSLPIAAPALGTVLDVMLRTPGRWETAAATLLRATLERAGPLLHGLGGALHAESLEDYPVPARQAALAAASVLGIALAAQDRKKEDYMHSQAFLVGRLLSLADTLHKAYCEDVRKGDIPPQLLGNALMVTAAENPNSAVRRLLPRLPVYHAWAQRIRIPPRDDDPEGRRTALIAGKWALREMGLVTTEIARDRAPSRTSRPSATASYLPAKMSDEFRAELLLGYLASYPTQNRIQEDGDDQ